MNIPWFIALFLGVVFLCGNSLAHISVLPIPKDFGGHGTQYRFQYFVRDERGDYKTQEEAGEGGRARGSYAVEEPNGEIRIVQYTADLGGGFKAHIKVDHGKKSGSKMEEIDIPAEEMRKLIGKNRRNSEIHEENVDVGIDESSKSYVIGPPKKMSEIVMEQAAAIREIISKEIEAEKKREMAEEKLRNEEKREKEDKKIETTNTTESYKIDKKSGASESLDLESQKTSTEKLRPGEKDNSKISEDKKIQISSTQSSDLNKLNAELDTRTSKERKIEEDKNTQSPVVRVALSPRNIDDVKIMDSKKVNDNDDNNYNNNNNNREEIYGEKEQSKISSEGPVRNFDFKNRIMFYKPAAADDKKLNQNPAPKDDAVSSSDNGQRKFQPVVKRSTDLIDKINNNNGEKEKGKKEGEIAIYFDAK